MSYFSWEGGDTLTNSFGYRYIINVFTFPARSKDGNSFVSKYRAQHQFFQFGKGYSTQIIFESLAPSHIKIISYRKSGK